MKIQVSRLSLTHHFACLAESSSKHPPECRLPRSTWPYDDYSHALSQLFIQLQCLLQLHRDGKTIFPPSFSQTILLQKLTRKSCFCVNVQEFLQYRVIQQTEYQFMYRDIHVCTQQINRCLHTHTWLGISSSRASL